MSLINMNKKCMKPNENKEINQLVNQLIVVLFSLTDDLYSIDDLELIRFHQVVVSIELILLIFV